MSISLKIQIFKLYTQGLKYFILIGGGSVEIGLFLSRICRDYSYTNIPIRYVKLPFKYKLKT